MCSTLLAYLAVCIVTTLPGARCWPVWSTTTASEQRRVTAPSSGKGGHQYKKLEFDYKQDLFRIGIKKIRLGIWNGNFFESGRGLGQSYRKKTQFWMNQTLQINNYAFQEIVKNGT